METRLWKFWLFKSQSGRKILEDWFNDQNDEQVFDEFYDQIAYLSTIERKDWKRPEFDTLDDGLCEIRWWIGGGRAYRMYGYFGPDRSEFMCLNAAMKKKSKDPDAEKVARKRKGFVDQNKGLLYAFKWK